MAGSVECPDCGGSGFELSGRPSWYLLIAVAVGFFVLGILFAAWAATPRQDLTREVDAQLKPLTDCLNSRTEARSQLVRALAEKDAYSQQLNDYVQQLSEIRSRSTVLFEPSSGAEMAIGAAALLLGLPQGLGAVAKGLAGAQPRWVIPMKVTPQIADGDGSYSWWNGKTLDGPYPAEKVKP